MIRELFTEELFVCLKPKQNTIETRCITNAQIGTVIATLESTTDPKLYYYRKKYYVVAGEENRKLAAIKAEGSKESQDTVHRLVVGLEDMWSVLWKIHTSVSFNGRKAMEHEASKFYHNVTRPIMEKFLNYSEQYQIKRKRAVNHGLVVKPIMSEAFNSRMQIYLVDMQSLPCGENKWVLNAQDHLTKFLHLRPWSS